jgi:hypothetical protein
MTNREYQQWLSDIWGSADIELNSLAKRWVKHLLWGYNL